MERASVRFADAMKCLALTAAVLAFPFGKPAHAQSGDPPYTEQSRTGAGRPFAPIGVITPNHKIPATPDGLTLSDDVISSAFLISPCYALASYHGVFGEVDFDHLDNTVDHSSRFYVGQSSTAEFEYVSTAIPVAHGRYRVGKGRGADWALLKLDKCEGLNPDIGWIEISTRSWPAYPQNSLVALGYGEERSFSKLIKSRPCSALSDWGGDGSVLSNCPTIEGESGGPAMGHKENGALVGVLMTVAGNGKNRNIGIDLASLFDARPEFDVVRQDLLHWQVRNSSQMEPAPAPQH